MEKGIIIIGESDTGKTHIAKAIAKMFSNPVIMDVFSKSDNLFSKEYSDVDCLVIENVKFDQLEIFYNWISDGIIVQAYNGRKRYSYPKIIVTINAHPKDMPNWASLNARFEIIKLANRFPKELNY